MLYFIYQRLLKLKVIAIALVLFNFLFLKASLINKVDVTCVMCWLYSVTILPTYLSACKKTMQP